MRACLELAKRLGVYCAASLKGRRSPKAKVSVVRELNDRIAYLEMCSEQLRIHLRSVPKDSFEAEETRSDLLSMLQKLASLKGQRQRLAESLELEDAA